MHRPLPAWISDMNLTQHVASALGLHALCLLTLPLPHHALSGPSRVHG